MRSGNLVEPRHRDVLDQDLAALCGEVVHPAMALQSQIDGDEIVLEATGQRQKAIVLSGAEGEVHAFAFGRVPFPVIEAKFALVLQRDMKARGGAGRPALIEPLVGRSIGIKRHAISGVDEAMSRDKTGLTRTDDGDVPHCPSRYLCGR
jgi:hypothetical protein